ncbi:MAG: FAD-binding oxidoreductase [Balneolaceae bacterium]
MQNSGMSYWEKELFGIEYDLIIIGGGLTGQSVSYFYKKKHPDAKVLVLDRGFFPLGASTRNAGFACFGSITEHIADMKLESEAKIIDRIRRRFNGLNLLRETLGDDNIQYEEPGSYEIFTDKKIYQEAVAHLEQVNRWLVEATGVENVYSSAEINGFPAIKIELEGCLHPGKMIKTLYHKNLNEGVEFRWETHVVEIGKQDGIIRLKNGVELKSRQIIVATNSFTSSLIKEVKINAGRGYVFITKAIPDLKWLGTFHYDRGYYYFRNIGKDRILLGGARSVDIEKETTTEFGVNHTIKNHLMEFATKILKLPQGWEIEQEWSGIMGFTKTKCPVLEKVGNRCYVVAGLSGMGVALGMQLGKEAAELLDNN